MKITTFKIEIEESWKKENIFEIFIGYLQPSHTYSSTLVCNVNLYVKSSDIF